MTIPRHLRNGAWPRSWPNGAGFHRLGPGPVTGMSKLRAARSPAGAAGSAREKSGPAAGAAFFFRGGSVAPDPRRIGARGMCRLVGILPQAPRLIRPLSGGSVRCFTVPGEAGAGGRTHAPTAEGARWPQLSSLAQTRSGRYGGRSATLCRRPYAGESSSSSPEERGSSGGTVTFSGVTSPGMKVMSTSSPGSPSSFDLRPTRIVEPGSIARPST